MELRAGSRHRIWPAVLALLMLTWLVLDLFWLPRGPASTVLFAGLAVLAAFCLQRHRAWTKARQAAWLSQSTLDALSSHVAVLDATGTVVAINKAWRARLAEGDPSVSGCGLGSNYIDACAPLADEGTNTGLVLAAGVRQVIEKAYPKFEMEYSRGAEEKRWFSLRVSGFDDGKSGWAVVEQEEITARKRAEQEVEHSRATYRELATRDQLTGLHNRRSMDRILEEEASRHRRYGSVLALVMVDIDHFKRVNDEYGHQAGDAALQWLGNLLARNVRVVDKVARYGGEEFAIIAPELNGGEACMLAERLRGLVVSRPFVYKGPDGVSIEIPITVSLGVAALPGDAEEAELLVSAADKALYAAKRCGRNCTVQFRELDERLVP